MDLYPILIAVLDGGHSEIPTKRDIRLMGLEIRTAGKLSVDVSESPGRLSIVFQSPKPSVVVGLGVTVTLDKLDCTQQAAKAYGTGPLGIPVTKVIKLEDAP